MTNKIMNDLVFKYVFGQDTPSSKDALKGLLETFLDLKIKEVQLKNTNVPDWDVQTKDVRFDIVALLDNHTTIDIEMQMESTRDDLPNRFDYYQCKMVSGQEVKGKFYRDLKPCYVLAFLDVNLNSNEKMVQVFEDRNQDGDLFNQNRLLRKITVEMKKLKNKAIKDMDPKEQYVYYLKNCQNAQNDSKIKEILENEEAIRVTDKRLNEITDDYWDRLNKEFDELKRNENEMREKYYQNLYRDEGIALGEANTIRALSKSMSIEAIATALGKTTDEINEILKHK